MFFFSGGCCCQDFLYCFKIYSYFQADVIKFISVGDERAAGSFLLVGPEPAVTELGPKLVFTI